MDPTNQRAREGLERVEKHGDMGVDSSYDVEVEDMEGTDNEVYDNVFMGSSQSWD